MAAALWFGCVLLTYAVVTAWLAGIIAAVRLRRSKRAMLLFAVVPTALAISLYAPPQWRFAVAAAGIAVGAVAAVRVAGAVRIAGRDVGVSTLHVLLISGSALFLVPLVWMVVTSLKTDAQTNAFPPVWIPHPVLWRNYADALRFLPPDTGYGLLTLANTLVIAGMSVTGTLLASSLVAYGFARLRWPGRDWLFGLLLATMMLPDAVTMLPRFLIFRRLHWVDTLLPLWVPSFFASAFNVFLLRQFFLGIPQEIEDAATMDGCGPIMTWWRVMLPMIKPALAAVAIMTFLGAWRDFMGPLIYISSPEKMPVSYVLQLFNSAHGGEPALLMAATTLVCAPVIVLFFFTQRYFIEGVTLTGLGGR